MRALVIGADGFAGRWLTRHLFASGDKVVAVVGPRFRQPLDSSERTEQIDVRHSEELAQIVERARPDVVFDLAGISRREDREDIDAAVGVSVIGGMNALLACARLSPAPRLLFVSTAYVYQGSRDPLDEHSVVAPGSIYASAKLAAEQALLTVAPSIAVDVVIARPFNHIGPGQAESFLVPTLARQVALAVRRMSAPIIRVADSTIVRDYTDVRDVASAYRLVAEDGSPGQVYNVASGSGVSVAEVAHLLAAQAGIDISIETDGEPGRDEASIMIGDPGRTRSLGWRPGYELTSTLTDVLDEALARADVQPEESPAGSETNAG